jgi:ABC-type multidrug transport system fused ATPase/permease subunit
MSFIDEKPKVENLLLLSLYVEICRETTVQYENVELGYGCERKAVVTHLSLTINPGEKLAICGRYLLSTKMFSLHVSHWLT